MPEPLKHLYNQDLIDTLCRSIQPQYSDFNTQQFTTDIFDVEWESKELKKRMKHISVMLQKHLPSDYSKALDILQAVAVQFNGFEYMFFPGFVELYGLEDYEESIHALAHFTEFSSSEFAVRPFIVKHPKQMMKQMELWTKSPNQHIRRLASEGCRPRLPWATALTEFKKDPRPIIEVLTSLKGDESEYVRRSVANNLNDISKDHPELVLEISNKWLGDNPNTDKLVKHGCRTLLKQGNVDALRLFGFATPSHVQVMYFIVQKSVRLKETLQFSFTLNTTEPNLGKLRIEYGIDFMKKNGKLARKVFKISEADYSERTKKIQKNHSFRIISTRKYHLGTHRIALILNGQEVASQKFTLTKPLSSAQAK